MTTEYAQEAAAADASESEAGSRALRALSWMGNLYRRISLSMVLSILLHLGIIAVAALVVVYGGKGDNMFSTREIKVSLMGVDDVESGDGDKGQGHEEEGEPAKPNPDQENVQDESMDKLKNEQKDKADEAGKKITDNVKKTIDKDAAANQATADAAAKRKAAAGAAKRNEQNATRDGKAGSQKKAHGKLSAAEARRRAERASKNGREVSAQAGGGGDPIFAPPPNDAEYITYVVDHSGSMGGRLDIVKSHLIESIEGLTADKSFFVVFYQSGPTPMTPQKMYKATKENKQKAREFIGHIRSGGGTNPIPAVQIAMSMSPKPQMVYLLTDGQFHSGVAGAVKRLNPNTLARIDTICFLNKSGERVLKQIAKDNRGMYTFVCP